MKQIYPVDFKGTNVGEIAICTFGLYYDIFCQCKLPEKKLFRLYARSDGVEIDLGILIPEQDEYVVRTKVPVKKLICTDINFYVGSVNTARNMDLIVKPEETFVQLHNLEKLCLVRIAEEWYITWKDQTFQSSAKT